MITQNSIIHPSLYSQPSIAPELLARLRSIKTQRARLKTQVNTFSTIYYHPEFLSRRWYSPSSSLPLPHVISTQENGSKMNLFVLQSKLRLVLHLRMRCGLWWHHGTFDESDLCGVLPNCSTYSGRQLRAPATEGQVRALARFLQVDQETLPNLTAYNANLLIQEHILQEHITEVRRVIADGTRSHLIKAKKKSLHQKS